MKKIEMKNVAYKKERAQISQMFPKHWLCIQNKLMNLTIVMMMVIIATTVQDLRKRKKNLPWQSQNP